MIGYNEIFKIGIGPSSSHTVGPMKAAQSFMMGLMGQLDEVERVEAILYGSLAWTGRGHATDRAVLLGLAGELPETYDPDRAAYVLSQVSVGRIPLLGRWTVAFDQERDLVFDCVNQPPRHPNTMQMTAYGLGGRVLAQERWCSIGGGFVLREGEAVGAIERGVDVPHRYGNARELLEIGKRTGLSIADIVAGNERALHPQDEIEIHLRRIARAMLDCIDRGLATTGELPGGLKVKRRAADIFTQLRNEQRANAHTPHKIMDYVSVFAMAVNEENAAGGRVVTAPTNGAAGVIPAVLRYYRDFITGATEEGMDVLLLTAAAIGGLFKMNASISGAEVGCQGEVGVASSMAAAGLAAALGGTNAQIENAAEIAMEHHLGMTCDPVGGLVQIPCIERNAFGAIKAINAAALALRGDGTHKITLDQVIATMRQTGADMNNKYKETSQGGLAVNWVEC
ncbi:L-serine ammonia-lyase [Microvirga sp. VF16]|uniref:L-serine ammonia-lyase n=1 Tax=Microvirga sp. VF16 TaxID=2807101 RepID=UPI00193EA3A2|nr:L-serine ammonia-lyase [Microvirga sp. VF16]QRM33081.1 L-serine ammonia-lyase [Microvirga sp. VF16]